MAHDKHGEEVGAARLMGYLGKATQWGRELWVPGEDNGGFPVNVQDQHTPAFDAPFAQIVNGPFTLAADALIDAWSIEVTTGHSLIAGDKLLLQDIQHGRAMFATVMSVAGDNTVNIDSPINFMYHLAHTRVLEITNDLNVNGSGTRQVFQVGTAVAGVELDITRILFQLTCTDIPEFTDFGDIALGLTRGVMCRVVNGVNTNLFNLKSNADLAALMFDVSVYESAKVFNVNGIAARLTYGGQAKHGVTIRLAQGEVLEVIIQDDLSSLVSFRMGASGHLVTD